MKDIKPVTKIHKVKVWLNFFFLHYVNRLLNTRVKDKRVCLNIYDRTFSVMIPSSWSSGLLIDNRNVRYKNHLSEHWPNFSDFWKFSLKTLLAQASRFMRQQSQVFTDFCRVRMSSRSLWKPWGMTPMSEKEHPHPQLLQHSFLQGLEWPSRKKKQWKGQLHRTLVRGSVNLYFKVI